MKKCKFGQKNLLLITIDNTFRPPIFRFSPSVPLSIYNKWIDIYFLSSSAFLVRFFFFFIFSPPVIESYTKISGNYLDITFTLERFLDGELIITLTKYNQVSRNGLCNSFIKFKCQNLAYHCRILPVLVIQRSLVLHFTTLAVGNLLLPLRNIGDSWSLKIKY